MVLLRLQRFRILQGDDDGGAFSFSMDDEPQDATVSPGKAIKNIIKTGPDVGVHTLLWSETASAYNRVFDRQMLRNFDWRVLFQMSANDASGLSDSIEASRLGHGRGICMSEEQGISEKFRPFEPPKPEQLGDLA